MKVSKKIASVLLALLLLITTAAVGVTASAVDMPSTATLTIHKYVLPYSDELADEVTGVIGDTDGLTGTEADAVNIPDGAKPLDGVVFTAYYIGDNTATKPETPPTEGGFDLAATKNGVTTLEVGEGTEHKTGLYYIVEKSAPADVTTCTEPFYVYLPMTNTDGRSWNSNVHVYPKNLQILGAAKLTKSVFGLDYSYVNGLNIVVESPKFELVDADGTTLLTFELPKQSNKDGGVQNASVTIGTGDAVTASGEDNGKNSASIVAYSDVPSGLAEKYSALKAAVSNSGIMVADGLPSGTYTWKETRGMTLHIFDGVGDVELPYGDVAAEFTIGTGAGEGKSATAELSAGASFGEITGTISPQQDETVDNSANPVIMKRVQDRKTALDADKEKGDYYDNGAVQLTDDSQTAGASGKDYIYGMGEEFEWCVSMLVPRNQNSYGITRVTDALPAGVSLADGSAEKDIRCTLSRLGESAEEKLEGVAKASEENGKLVIDFASEELAEKAVKADAVTVLNIYIKSIITSAASVQAKLENKAYVAWQTANSVRAASAEEEKAADPITFTDPIESNTVWVATSGVKVVKIDSKDNNKTLSGAEFTLSEGSNTLKFELKNGVYYRSNAAEASDKLVSDASGLITIAGLAAGDYSMKETKAPAGYQLLADAATVSVTANSYNAKPTAIQNVPEPELPHTGGNGVFMFTLTACIVAAAAALVFIIALRLRKKGI